MLFHTLYALHIPTLFMSPLFMSHLTHPVTYLPLSYVHITFHNYSLQSFHSLSSNLPNIPTQSPLTPSPPQPTHPNQLSFPISSHQLPTNLLNPLFRTIYTPQSLTHIHRNIHTRHIQIHLLSHTFLRIFHTRLSLSHYLYHYIL